MRKSSPVYISNVEEFLKNINDIVKENERRILKKYKRYS